MRGSRLLAGLAVAVVVGAIVAGLAIIGPPGQERARRLDNRRVADLRQISRAVDLYWTRHGRLPASLDELSEESAVAVNSSDPDTVLAYEFRISGNEAYEICAEFQTQTETDPAARARGRDFWSHSPGRHCFQLKAKEVTHRIERQPEVQAN